MKQLWSGGPYYADDPAFKITTDSVLLANFAGKKLFTRCMDIGCGGGIISVLLHSARPDAVYDSADIREDAVRACTSNYNLNMMQGRVFCADARMRRELGASGSYDLVVSNPPYYYNATLRSPDPGRAAARGDSLSPAQFSGAAGYLLKYGGRFCLVHKPEFLADIFTAMHLADIEPKRLRLVCHTADSEPSLVLIEGVRGGKPSLSVEPNLILCGSDGKPTEEIRTIYHMHTR